MGSGTQVHQRRALGLRRVGWKVGWGEREREFPICMAREELKLHRPRQPNVRKKTPSLRAGRTRGQSVRDTPPRERAGGPRRPGAGSGSPTLWAEVSPHLWPMPARRFAAGHTPSSPAGTERTEQRCELSFMAGRAKVEVRIQPP